MVDYLGVFVPFANSSSECAARYGSGAGKTL
jgi:hypothetical protein